MARGRAAAAAARASSRATETSLSRVWAWWAAGLMAYIPANIYPMLITRTLMSEQDSTIVGGVVELVHHGAIGIAHRDLRGLGHDPGR